MPLVFAAITPHPPILIPDIGKDNIIKIQATKNALEKMEENLYVAKPDTILIISPHGRILPDAFSINTNPTYTVDLREFGDLTTQTQYQSDMTMIARISNEAKLKEIPLALYTDHALDYGSAVPLHYLTKHLPEVKIIPLSYSLLEPKQHLNFGYLLKEEIMSTNRRVAVIASGDLSHALTSDAPAGFSLEGKKFDENLMENLKNHNTTALLNLEPQICESAAECGRRSFLILLGILQRVNYKLKILSYEGPLGVGYLVAEFVLE
ncbi:MAG: AmmeMemoRadiSam system protein B [Candidatus Magasanikbacteria bacterium]|nr:AmmeMemoRadiSam system protein B [Candidatus Magasanikbacteria bacterium]